MSVSIFDSHSFHSRFMVFAWFFLLPVFECASLQIQTNAYTLHTHSHIRRVCQSVTSHQLILISYYIHIEWNTTVYRIVDDDDTWVWVTHILIWIYERGRTQREKRESIMFCVYFGYFIGIEGKRERMDECEAGLFDHKIVISLRNGQNWKRANMMMETLLTRILANDLA